MNVNALAQFGLFLLIVTLLVRPTGSYMRRVFAGERTWLDPALRPVERLIYRALGVDPAQEMDWSVYALAFVLFSLGGALLLALILSVQPLFHTFDPQFRPGPLTWDLTLNTAISFATTTTWQAYGGETTMSYFSQMVGLTAQNFLAGAAGLAVGIGFIRGLARERSATIGNFWVDLVRATLWVLLPISIIGSLALVWQGVPLNLRPYQEVVLLQPITADNGDSVSTQVLPMGPVAALELIKNLGTNGGGFFNVNSAHPFENPTPLTNLIELLAIVLLPAALTSTFGQMIGRRRDGWLLYVVMTILFVAGLALGQWAEQQGTPQLAAQGVDLTASDLQAGGNMEGKETRLGITGSVLGAVVTSNGATGSYNAMHDSFTPLGGAVALANMLLGEIVYGGLGSGLYSMVLVALIGLFIGSLMIGRTPEYLGKQIGPPEMKLVGVYTVLAPVTVLLLTALAVATNWGKAGLMTNSGAHGFSEILVSYTSAFANNGQNFAGLSANSPFYNLSTAVAMLVGRFGLGVLALALAGNLAQKPRRPSSAGTFATDSPLFGLILLGTILIVGGLSYVPGLAMGPIVEQLSLYGG